MNLSPSKVIELTRLKKLSALKVAEDAIVAACAVAAEADGLSAQALVRTGVSGPV
jgi:hypothetical protein